jgi:hypothetical protein
MQTDKQFFVRLLGIVAIGMLFFGLIIVAVDPFGKLHYPWLGMYYSSERESKSRFVRVYPHNALIVGSSRTASIDPDMISCQGVKFFNASFSSAQPEEIYNFLDLNAHDDKVVLIGLDIFMFNEGFHEYSPETFKEDGIDTFRYVFSMDTLGYSWGTVKKWIGGKKHSIRVNGQRNMEEKDRRDAAMTGYDYEETLRLLRTEHYANLIFSAPRVRILDKIQQLMEDRGITTIFFWNPIHPAIYQYDFDDHVLQQFYHRVKSEVAKAVPGIKDLSEAESDAEGFYKNDPVHYYPAMGARLVHEMLDNANMCDRE